MILSTKEKLKKLRDFAYEFSNQFQSIENNQYLPLAIEEVEMFEKRHGITFPEEYRNFLLHIGNGGMGPIYGVLPLDIHKTDPKLHLPWTDPVKYNKLFQYNSQEEDVSTINDYVDNISTNDLKTISILQEIDNGILPIANVGWGSFHCLVITGKNRGQVWTNGKDNGKNDSVVFISDNFLEWYEKWLNHKLAQAQENNKTTKKLYSDDAISPFFSYAFKERQAFLDKFKNLRDKQPIKNLFNRIFNEKQPREIVYQCIDYLLDNPEHMDYNLDLEVLKDLPEDEEDGEVKKKLCLIGKILVRSGKLKEAITYFEEAYDYKNKEIEKRDLDKEYFRLLCYCYFALGETEKALSTIASENYPYDSGEAISLLYELLNTYKDYKITTQWGEFLLGQDFIKQDGGNKYLLPDIYHILIHAYAKLKNEKQIQKYMAKLIQTKDDRECVDFEDIALELFSAKCYSSALDCLEIYASFPIAKDNLQWLYNLQGCCYADQGNYKKGIEYFEKSYRIHHWIVPYSNLIRPCIHLEKYDEAKQIFNEIVAFNPYYCWSYYQFALYHIIAKDRGKALKLLRKAVFLGLDKNLILDDPELKSIVHEFKK